MPDLSDENLPLIALTIPGPDSDAINLKSSGPRVIDFDDQMIKIQFDFEQPLSVSANAFPDQIYFDFKPG